MGNAISRRNLELEFVLDHRIPFQSMAQQLHDEFLMDRQAAPGGRRHPWQNHNILPCWLASDQAGRAPSFLIGGIPENFGSSFAGGSGSEFILEGDEYDTAFFDKGPKFLHYFPDAAILTSVEFDHADIYHNLEEVKTAFKRLVNLIPRRGMLIAWDGHPNVDECVRRALQPGANVMAAGENSAWRIAEVAYCPDRTRWRVLLRTGVGRLRFPLAGEYNVLNATAAAALAANYGISKEAIAAALKEFRSVKRRLEVKAEIHGITIIDDFAHHPTAIAQTLKAVRTRYAGRRLWAVLEPRSNTLRRRVFQHELAASLAVADEVVLADVFKSEAIPEAERLDPAAVIADLRAGGTPARLLANADVIAETIAPELRPGDVVAILSNGGFGGIYEKLPAKLKSLHQVAISS